MAPPGIRTRSASNVDKTAEPEKQTAGGDNQTEICRTCDKITLNNKRLLCQICATWFHPECQKVDDGQYQLLQEVAPLNAHWYCLDCNRVAVGLLTTMTKMQTQMDHLAGDVFSLKCSVKNIQDGKFTEKMKETVAATAAEALAEVGKVKDRIHKLEEGNITEQMKKSFANAVTESGAGAGAGPSCEDRDESLTRTIMHKVNNKLSRQKNVIVFGIKESKSNLKSEIEKSDQKEMKAVIDHVGADLEGRDIVTRRLGRRDKEGAKEEDKNAEEKKEEKKEEEPERPLLVQFESDRDKTIFMKRLYKLKGSNFNISIKHDMTREEREQEKELREQAKTQNGESVDPQVFYAVRGELGDRKVVKVKIREGRDL